MFGELKFFKTNLEWSKGIIIRGKNRDEIVANLEARVSKLKARGRNAFIGRLFDDSNPLCVKAIESRNVHGEWRKRN